MHEFTKPNVGFPLLGITRTLACKSFAAHIPPLRLGGNVKEHPYAMYIIGVSQVIFVRTSFTGLKNYYAFPMGLVFP